MFVLDSDRQMIISVIYCYGYFTVCLIAYHSWSDVSVISESHMSNDVYCKVNQIVCIVVLVSKPVDLYPLQWTRCVAATTPPYQTTPRRMVPIAIRPHWTPVVLLWQWMAFFFQVKWMKIIPIPSYCFSFTLQFAHKLLPWNIKPV